MNFDFKDDEIFAVISFKALDDIYSRDVDLINDIIKLSTDGDTALLKKAKKLQEGVGLLERIENKLILQPNLYGLGIDLKQSEKKLAKKSLFTVCKSLF